MAAEKLGFGIIGCGMIAEWHAGAIAAIPGVRLIGATDVMEKSRTDFAAKYGVLSFDSVEKMLANPAIDILSICTPSGLHASQAILAAAAGKHVIVEKPMALNLEEADQVIAACAKKGVQLAVISQLRFSPAIHQVKQALENKILGRLVLGDLYMKFYRSQEYYDKGNWRGTWEMDGGGALMNQGIHGVDLLRYLMGPVKTIFANCRTLARNIAVEDTATALLEYQNGALGVIEATTSVYPGVARRIEIHGDRGTIALEEDRIVKWVIEGQDPPEQIFSGQAAGAKNDSANNPAAFGIAGHIKQLADMAEAVRNRREPLVNGGEGRKALEIIMGVYRSSQNHQIIELES